MYLTVLVCSQVYCLCGFRKRLISLFYLSKGLQQVRTEDSKPQYHQLTLYHQCKLVLTSEESLCRSIYTGTREKVQGWRWLLRAAHRPSEGHCTKIPWADPQTCQAAKPRAGNYGWGKTETELKKPALFPPYSLEWFLEYRGDNSNLKQASVFLVFFCFTKWNDPLRNFSHHTVWSHCTSSMLLY